MSGDKRPRKEHVLGGWLVMPDNHPPDLLSAWHRPRGGYENKLLHDQLADAYRRCQLDVVKQLYEKHGKSLFFNCGTSALSRLFKHGSQFIEGEWRDHAHEQRLEIVRWLVSDDVHAYGESAWLSVQNSLFYLHGPQIEVLRILLDAGIFRVTDKIFAQVHPVLRSTMTGPVEQRPYTGYADHPQFAEDLWNEYERFLFEYRRPAPK